MKTLKNQKGITLVELLIGALMSLIIVSAVLGFYVTQHDHWLVQEEISDMQQNGRALLDELTRYIRKAGYGMAGSTAFRIDGDTLTIFVKESAKVDTTKFYVSTAVANHPNLMKKVNTQAAQLFAENIESVQFVQSGTAIQVNLTAREDTKDDTYTGDKYRRRVLQSRIKIRNL